MTETLIKLPTEKVKADFLSPRKMIIFSKPKVGKTKLAAQLENSLIIDLERGTGFLDAVKYDILSEAEKSGRTPLQEIKALCDAIKAQGKPYKYGIIDTVTALEDIVLPLANKLYQQTPMGKSWTGSSVLTLPNGAGYLYLREAFIKVLDDMASCFERIILLGHFKGKSIEKTGTEVSAADLDLIGKLKNILSAEVDAIGLLYRGKNNQNILSFKTADEVICGARPEHLKMQDIIISEENGKEFKTYWEKVFID
jgi:hypothetical protein